MNTEDNHGKSHMAQRITAATILGFMAVALVGSAINRMLQSGQEPWPYWAIWLLVAGGVLFVIALLILVESNTYNLG